MFSSEGRKFSCYCSNTNLSVIFHGKRSFIVPSLCRWMSFWMIKWLIYQRMTVCLLCFCVFLGLVKCTECHELLRTLFSTHKPPGFPVFVQFYVHFVKQAVLNHLYPLFRLIPSSKSPLTEACTVHPSSSSFSQSPFYVQILHILFQNSNIYI